MGTKYITELTSLECFETEDFGYDNQILEYRIDGGAWVECLQATLNDDQTADVNVELIFEEQVEVRLFDYDVADPNDYLGTVVIKPDSIWGSEMSTSGSGMFTEDNDARYELNWSIMSVEQAMSDALEKAEAHNQDRAVLTRQELEDAKVPEVADSLDTWAMGQLSALVESSYLLRLGDLIHAFENDAPTSEREVLWGALWESLLPISGIIDEFKKKQYGSLMLCGDINVGAFVGPRYGSNYGLAVDLKSVYNASPEARLFMEVGAGAGTNVGGSGGFWFGFNRNVPKNVGGPTLEYIHGFRSGVAGAAISFSFDGIPLFNTNLQEVCYGLQSGSPIEISGGVAYNYVLGEELLSKEFLDVLVG